MSSNSAAARYHQRTKYSPETLGQGHFIDWNSPPAQFKEYRGAERRDLRPFLPMNENPLADPAAGLRDSESPLSLPRLAMLLFMTNGVTGIAHAGPQTHYFRAAPSAGALYPTDLYLLSRDHPDLPDGVHYFHVRDHSLLEVYPPGVGPSGTELFERLQAACFGDPALREARLALVATCVFWRSAWRYGERGYRRCLLDSGHVLGNLGIAAPRLGLAASAVGGFVDAEVAELLGISPEKEGVLAVLPLLDAEREGGLPRGPSARPATADEGDAAADAILDVHNAGAIRAGSHPEAPAAEDPALLLNPKYEFAKGIKLRHDGRQFAEQMEMSILRRRSTRQLSGQSISVTELADLLAFAYRADLVGDTTPPLFDPSLLESFVLVNSAEGIEPGLYYFAPGFMELLLVKAGDLRREIYHLSLGQDLARDASVVVIHTADLEDATRRYGARAYRYLHLDAGHIGERLNVAAVRMGLGVSGIGGFFDDEVNALLDIPPRELCVYITCLGRPV